MYIRITLRWGHANGAVQISMPRHVHMDLAKYNHPKPSLPQDFPCNCVSPQYGRKQIDDPDIQQLTSHSRGTAYPLPEDHWCLFILLQCSLQYNFDGYKFNISATKQITEHTTKKLKTFMNYCATHLEASI